MIDPLLEGLADPDPEKRRRAIFGVLSHRRHDLVTLLYELALAEKDAGLAVLATQAVLSLRSAPADQRQDALIERAVTDQSLESLEESAWEYLETAGTRRQRLLILAMLARRGSPLRQARGFLEHCISHCDPDVRIAACRPAAAAGSGRLLAWVLAAIEDPDAGVGREAVAAIQDVPRSTISGALEEALSDPDEWVPACVAEFLPVLADEEMRETISRGTESALPRVAVRSREALARLDARKLSRQLPPPPPIPKSPEKPPEIQYSLPSSGPSLPKPAVSVPPSGPLPWAHLVAPPAVAQPATRPASGQEVRPGCHASPPASTVSIATEASREPSVEVHTPVALSAEATERPKLDRVISMRNKIAAGTLVKPVEPPLAPALIQAEPPSVSQTVPAASFDSQPRSPADNVAPLYIPHDTSELAEADVWEAVSIDFAVPREPRLAVQLDPALHDGAPASDSLGREESPADIAASAVLEPNGPAPRIDSGAFDRQQDGTLTLAKPPMIDTILGRYPSFVTGPLERFFQQAAPAVLMQALRAAIDPLIAFLSFTFLQTYLFFGSRTAKGDQAARDALNAHFSGPASVRLLHHLSLSVREVPGDAFFSTGLAKKMNESSEGMNPLFMLREVTEFLKTPPGEAGEGLRQVAGGLPALLAACKEILQNPIVLKLPPGAREPYLNLSGPRPCPLSASERPGLDLPANEIVVLSKDRSEALGLFPYFTFDGRSVTFGVPSDAEFKTLLERLGLTV